ncbi:MAG TPA: hypothetical protein VKS19_03115 [Verrucomicrobiae bacterium]|nr:hypothetical protein [Verrucomicrobiae bacterium]
MIALLSDCLLFQLTNGESVPCSAEMISVELVGDNDGWLDPEVLRHAAASVFHYFKKDLCRESVTVGEFAGALEKVLRKLGFTIRAGAMESRKPDTRETDLGLMARESGDGFELFFFPRLRDELRAQLRQAPRVLRFRGLRGCVKQLTGARRWSVRCEKLQDHIVEYLRQCLTAEPESTDCALVVE